MTTRTGGGAGGCAVIMEEQARAGVRATDHAIREHPYESIGIAFGVGMLLGVLINRK